MDLHDSEVFATPRQLTVGSVITHDTDPLMVLHDRRGNQVDRFAFLVVRESSEDEYISQRDINHHDTEEYVKFCKRNRVQLWYYVIHSD